MLLTIWYGNEQKASVKSHKEEFIKQPLFILEKMYKIKGGGRRLEEDEKPYIKARTLKIKKKKRLPINV